MKSRIAILSTLLIPLCAPSAWAFFDGVTITNNGSRTVVVKFYYADSSTGTGPLASLTANVGESVQMRCPTAPIVNMYTACTVMVYDTALPNNPLSFSISDYSYVSYAANGYDTVLVDNGTYSMQGQWTVTDGEIQSPDGLILTLQPIQ